MLQYYISNLISTILHLQYYVCNVISTMLYMHTNKVITQTKNNITVDSQIFKYINHFLNTVLLLKYSTIN